VWGPIGHHFGGNWYDVYQWEKPGYFSTFYYKGSGISKDKKYFSGRVDPELPDLKLYLTLENGKVVESYQAFFNSWQLLFYMDFHDARVKSYRITARARKPGVENPEQIIASGEFDLSQPDGDPTFEFSKTPEGFKVKTKAPFGGPGAIFYRDSKTTDLQHLDSQVVPEGKLVPKIWYKPEPEDWRLRNDFEREILVPEDVRDKDLSFVVISYKNMNIYAGGFKFQVQQA